MVKVGCVDLNKIAVARLAVSSLGEMLMLMLMLMLLLIES